MKVKNMTSAQGNTVPNQFIIERAGRKYFQSYATIIACINALGEIKLDRDKWNYSKTTSQYRNQFLGETTKETQKKIDSGEYVLADLN